MNITKVRFKNKTISVLFSKNIDDIHFEGIPSLYKPGESLLIKSVCGKYLLKIRIDRYFLQSNPLKWFSRLILRRIIFRPESMKESRANHLMKRNGLSVVDSFGWGGAVNPFNAAYSFYLMRNMANLCTIKDRLPNLTSEQIRSIIDEIVSDIVKCARNGFSPSDVTPQNLLLNHDNSILWIDTNIEHVNKKYLTQDFIRYEILRHWTPNLSTLIQRAFEEKAIVKKR